MNHIIETLTKANTVRPVIQSNANGPNVSDRVQFSSATDEQLFK